MWTFGSYVCICTYKCIYTCITHTQLQKVGAGEPSVGIAVESWEKENQIGSFYHHVQRGKAGPRVHWGSEALSEENTYAFSIINMWLNSSRQVCF